MVVTSDPRPRDVVRFHARQKMTLLAHSQEHYRRLGRIIAGAGTTPMPDLVTACGEGLMDVLAIPAVRGRQVDVLLHLAGFLRSGAASRRRRELAAPIDGHELCRIPRFLPLMLLREVLTCHRLEWARSQTYLEPRPLEQMLRDPT